MLIIKKYLIKELMFCFGVIFSLLIFIYSSNQLIELLSKVANGKLNLEVACQLILCYLPEICGILIPLALFLAILSVISKLYADNEIVILSNLGLGWGFLYKTIIPLSMLCALLNAAVTMWLVPYAGLVRENFLATTGSKIINAIIPGNFNIFDNGQSVIYVGKINANKDLEQVFISLPGKNPNAINVITAQSGNLTSNNHQNSTTLTLKQGSQYYGIPGYSNLWVINFLEYTKQFFSKEKVIANPIKTTKTIDLWQSLEPAAIAEFEWRLAIPISGLVLSIIAISLGKVGPRKGRFARFIPAILIYIIYANSMLFMRRFIIAHQVTHHWIEIGLVHLIFLCFGLILLPDHNSFSYYSKKLCKH